MAWADYKMHHTETNTIIALSDAAQVLLVIVLIGIITSLGIRLLRKRKGYIARHKEIYKELHNRRSWRLTNSIYWTLGILYSFSALLRANDNFLVFSFIIRLVVASVLYLVLRDVYCYIQFGAEQHKKDES